MTVPIVSDIHLNRAAVFLVDDYDTMSPSHAQHARGIFVYRDDWGHTLPEDVRLALDACRSYEAWDTPGALMRIVLEQLLEDDYQNDAEHGALLSTWPPTETVDYPVVVVDLAFKQVAFALAEECTDTEAWTEHMGFQSYTHQTVADYPGEAHEKEVEAAYQSLVAD